MSVTVIIVNFNSGLLLSECLAHLQAQTVAADNILVIDNASSDGSANVAQTFPNIVLHQSTENLGFAGGNNLALACADTEFVALLNPDAFPAHDWLERLLAAAALYPDVAAFGSRQLCSASSDTIDGIGDSYHISGLVWRRRHGARQTAEDLMRQEIFSPCAAAALYRRQMLIEVGGFDKDYFCYVEDVDLGFRLRLAGYKSMYVPDAIVSHVGSATTGGSSSEFSVYHGHRNLVWTFIKNMPGVLFWLLLPCHLLLNLLTLGVFSLRGKGRVIFRAKWDALKGIPNAWSKRKQIQARRLIKAGDIWRVLDKRLLPRKNGR